MKARHFHSLLVAAAVLAAPVAAHSQKGVNEKIPRAGVQFDAPVDWVRVAAGDWIRFKPKDEFARLGFVVFDKPGEATSRLGQMAEQFELSNLTWGGASDTVIGPSKLPGRMATAATCTLKNGDPCFLWYATVNPGTPEQILIAYLVNTAKGEKHRTFVHNAVQSLRKL
jgi:hypothetical protein